MASISPSPPPGRRALVVATFASFALAGFAFASWAGRIPAVRTTLGLTSGQLGVLLLLGAAGSLTGLPLAGRVATRIGTARTVLGGAALVMVGMLALGPAIVEARSAALTAAVLYVITLGMGVWDVAMNLHGAEVDHSGASNLMPRFHAGFSMGTVLGAVSAALLTAGDVGLQPHFATVGVALFAAIWLATRAFLPRAPRPEVAAAATGGHSGATGSAWREPRVLMVGVVVMIAAFTEGTANDWLSLAFVDGHGVPEWAGILGLATFLTAMTAGRIVGAAFIARHGRAAVLRATFAAAAVGAVMTALGSPAVAYAGAAVWGVGASLGFPVGMSAAADDPARAAARVSVVSTIGYVAFLAGPPLLGFLADHWGVLRALLVVAAMAMAAVAAAPATEAHGDGPCARRAH